MCLGRSVSTAGVFCVLGFILLHFYFCPYGAREPTGATRSLYCRLPCHFWGCLVIHSYDLSVTQLVALHVMSSMGFIGCMFHLSSLFCCVFCCLGLLCLLVLLAHLCMSRALFCCLLVLSMHLAHCLGSLPSRLR